MGYKRRYEKRKREEKERKKKKDSHALIQYKGARERRIIKAVPLLPYIFHTLTLLDLVV